MKQNLINQTCPKTVQTRVYLVRSKEPLEKVKVETILEKRTISSRILFIVESNQICTLITKL